ncbi:MAG: ankyrin repeat domain-containing protein [Thermodesulfobacteriota bacterium]
MKRYPGNKPLKINYLILILVPVVLLLWPPAAPFAEAANFIKLFTAIANNDLEEVRALAPQGPSINAVDRASGATPLTWACMKGIKPAIAAHLISLGADIEQMDGEGNTPLGTAATYGNAAAARLLLEKGANPNAPDGRKNLPIILASGHSGHLEIVQTLTAKGAKIEDQIGKTAVQTALDCNKPEIVRFLVEKGARIGYFQVLKRLWDPEQPPLPDFDPLKSARSQP